MRTLATKQPAARDSAHQKLVKKAPVPGVRSLSSGLTGSAMLQRKPGCACGGGCPRCQSQALLQTKLKISEPGDKYEQEADRIADEVMRMPEPAVQPEVEPEEEEEIIQRKAIAQQDSSEVSSIVNEVVNSSGQPLDPQTRTFMESRFRIVINPLLGARLLYLPLGGDRTTHLATILSEVGLRVQQPLQGIYLDLRVGGYVGMELPSPELMIEGGFSGLVGLGYRWERVELGAEAWGALGIDSPNQFIVLGMGSVSF